MTARTAGQRLRADVNNALKRAALAVSIAHQTAAKVPTK